MSLPSPGDLPNPGIELAILTSPALAGGFFAPSRGARDLCWGWLGRRGRWGGSGREIPPSSLETEGEGGKGVSPLQGRLWGFRFFFFLQLFKSMTVLF